MPIPDWQLPSGVDRGLWDYMNSRDMVEGYDAQMAASPLACVDVRFCEATFPTPGKLIDLGCGTGRLTVHFARKGYECLGVDLSPEMLAKARQNAMTLTAGEGSARFEQANLVELQGVQEHSFEYAACLFSTLGMIRGEAKRDLAMRRIAQILRPGGRFVLHVHNRWYHQLGWKRFRSGDITMTQAYGGAPLTLHHFSRREAVRLIELAGLRVIRIEHVGATAGAEPIRPGLLGSWRTYGYLIAAEKASAP